MTQPLSTTARTTITRDRERGRTDRADLYGVLDSGLVCHLGIVRDGGPVVLPTGYGRIGDTVYVHGSTGAGYLRIIDGTPVCLTVTHVDGIVYARSVFHHSMNYRSAVVLADARVVRDADERWNALEAITEQLAPGSWEHARRPHPKELAATAVIAIDLSEASVKMRVGPPVDDAADVEEGGRWAGVLPVRPAFDGAQTCPTLPSDEKVPAHVTARASG
ncbi:pyridoxamine 5'-phosphate oxidase family protein [Pseudonocardia sp. GCM10023141]|uniref:pyridoxamine 5'-phosphate oxidase family protein n=1 Tax=Pseudonocardia sp. GCM10023141 TaxID=3252653 RepID=UPI00361B47FF